jgi:ABC-2 type transport system ATP-binding protein
MLAVMTTTAAPPQVAIRFEGLRKSYGAITAVDGIDVEIAPGEVVALLGPNGAGKSTTIDMLLGLTRPDSGTVSVFGQSPRAACAAGKVGAMLQTGTLPVDFTVREVVEVMRALAPSPLATAEVLRRARIEDIASQRTQKLSGGQRQRVRFALAIAADPQLVVLDEPTVAMDVETRHLFWQSMRAWAAEGRTVVFATHYLEEADDFADRIVLMRRGAIVVDGPTTEVKAMAGDRMIRATVPASVSLDGLAALPGVASVERHGGAVLLRCPDSDAALRALLASQPQAQDIEVTGSGLEEAFLALTADETHETEEGA